MRASQQDGTYPRPQLVRDRWTSLDGTWDFAYDDEDCGAAERWYEPGSPRFSTAFNRRIEVPYPPESPASGIGDIGFHPVVWYRRTLPVEVQARSGDDRLLLHFGAVDHSCQVWVGGRLVATHEGGQTPFSADISDVLAGGPTELVVRAEDDPYALDQLRGKQDWQSPSHGIWYERTTGIWQPVWLETVSSQHIADVAWTPDLVGARVRADLELARTPGPGERIAIRLSLDDETLAELTLGVSATRVQVEVPIVALANGQDRARLAWTPEQPRLIDAEVTLLDGSGQAGDRIFSYLGLREVGVGDGSFLLNGQPYYTRSVLDQGYRPETHLAARDTKQLRGEVETIKALGFNAARVHQKAEDPRFLFWADRLGLMIWGETAAAYAFSPTAVTRLTAEWAALIRRDRSHPCIVAWVPINESWGVQDIAASPAQQQFSQAIVSLTRALDGSRPAVSNEGWEHIDSDILGVHDYTTDATQLRSRYAGRESVEDTVLSGRGPAGRRIVLSARQESRFREGEVPLMITEFGGVSLSAESGSWGYEQVDSPQEYAASLAALFAALRASPYVTGFCYTQFMDTGQETNGLLYADGTPKLPVEQLYEIVTGAPPAGAGRSTSTFGWS